ncbi:MAG: FixH family protein [Bernardetiaceae bacterium]|nr:FixH family protein [Bernardetiaceae bacterium]
MKIKFNWGTGIFITYVIYMIGIMSLVISFITQKIDLVTPEYYAEEIAYQDRIDDINNARSLAAPIVLAHDSEQQQLAFEFSEEAAQAEGTIYFFRPSDKNLDKTLPFVLEQELTHSVATNDLANGLWKVKIQWKKDGKSFYEEHTWVK